jgi:hypothetical protein
MFVFDIFWPIAVPINAVEKSRNVGKVFLMESAFILLGIFVVILLVEFKGFVQWSHHLFRVYVSKVNCSCMLRIVWVIAKFLNFIGMNVFNREVFQHFQATFGCSAPPSDGENHRSQFLWNGFLHKLLSNQLQVIICL